MENKDKKMMLVLSTGKKKRQNTLNFKINPRSTVNSPRKICQPVNLSICKLLNFWTFEPLNILHQRPFAAEAQIKEVSEIHHIYDGKSQVIFNAVLFETLADHNTQVGEQGGGKEQEEMHIEQCVIGLLIFRKLFIAEEQ